MMPKVLRFLQKTVFYLLISGVAMAITLPFLWMISTSLKQDEAIMILPIRWIPRRISFQSYRDIFVIYPLLRAALNSFTVSVLTTLITLLSASMAGFAFAKFDFWGKNQLFLLFLATMMVPGAVTMIPNFLVLRNLHLINTFAGLAIPSIYNVWALFLIRQNIMSLPEAFFEAAVIDGGSAFTLYARIVLPLVKPILATLAVITFMGTWNDFLWPLIVLSGDVTKMTLPLALNAINSRWGEHWNMLMAGNLISIMPIVVIYLLAQKYFESGISVGGLKA